MYFHDATTERLVRVALSTGDTGLDAVLRLLEGPGGSGLPIGNPLDDVEVVRSAEVARGRATVDLADSFVDLSGTDQRIALAELVYTATGRPGVGQVSFTLEGEPTEVPAATARSRPSRSPAATTPTWLPRTETAARAARARRSARAGPTS